MKTKIILLLIFFIFISCNDKKEKIEQPQPTVKMTENKKYSDQIQALEKSMIKYLESAEVSYKKNDVEECINILNQYLKNIAKTSSKEEGLQVVKSTVLQLNDLNEKCDFGLIETSERETIAVIIISVSADKGYNTIDEDITEELREW